MIGSITTNLVSISIHASAKEATHKGDSNFKRHNFNPRLREGGDNGGWDFARLLIISIHASAKEATVAPSNKRVEELISIHASAKEATAEYLQGCNHR